MADDSKVEVEFELPLGIPHKGGVLKNGTMRRMTNGDIIAVHQDARMKQLARDDIALTDDNPVKSMAAMGATFQMYHFIFARTVTRLGDVNPDDIRPDLFKDMYSKDMMYLMNVHNELNDMNVTLPGMEGQETPLAETGPEP
jgi:hypothetical protein